jgi:NADPH2 dehydrogenase
MSALFQPIKLGNIQLNHRVVLAPMTRVRTNPDGSIKADIVKEYYEQRASVPGTLLISEGTLIAEKASGFPGGPAFWTDEQIGAWKEVSYAIYDLYLKRAEPFSSPGRKGGSR